MYVLRTIFVIFLILAVVFSYSPQGRMVVSQSWVSIRPDVIQLMDGMYATIRNFVAGIDSENGIDGSPPGVNFDKVITRLSTEDF